MGFLTRCKRLFSFAFLLQNRNTFFSFFLKSFLILSEKQHRHVFIRQPVYFKNGNRQNAFGERIAETEAIGKNKAAGYPRGISISLFFRHSTFRLFPQLQPPQE